MAENKKSRKVDMIKHLSSMFMVWVLAGKYCGDLVRRVGDRLIHDGVVYVVGECYFPVQIGVVSEKVC